MNADTITIDRIRALADQLAADAEAVRKIERQAKCGDITPAQAVKLIRNAGLAIIP
jgi:hypothetical protein